MQEGEGERDRDPGGPLKREEEEEERGNKMKKEKESSARVVAFCEKGIKKEKEGTPGAQRDGRKSVSACLHQKNKEEANIERERVTHHPTATLQGAL